MAPEGGRWHRLSLLDAVRGFSVLSMVAFHLCYDLKFIVGIPLTWFAPPLQDIWRASISWTFIGLAGFMCALSRNNLKRAFLYGYVALSVFLATSLAAVDAPISFGVIYCMAACTLVEWLLVNLDFEPEGPIPAAILALLFLVTLPISSGHIGIGGLIIPLPRQWYATTWLAWLGLPGPGFISGDYYPLLPYLFLYLSGSALGWWCKYERGFPEILLTRGPFLLDFAGRYSLFLYIIHQPILLLLCGALG